MNPVRTEPRPPAPADDRFSDTVDLRILAYEPERMPRVRWADADPVTPPDWAIT